MKFFPPLHSCYYTVAGHEGKPATCRNRPDVDEHRRRVHHRDVGSIGNRRRHHGVWRNQWRPWRHDASRNGRFLADHQFLLHLLLFLFPVPLSKFRRQKIRRATSIDQLGLLLNETAANARSFSLFHTAACRTFFDTFLAHPHEFLFHNGPQGNRFTTRTVA